MPVINRIAGLAPEMKAWRRHLHAHPELGFDCHATAAFVVERLRAAGVDEIHEGLATSGVVALIRGREPGPVIGLRADMDALPMDEDTGAAHASTVPGRMHACGHDGHTTMLLGAATYLAETRNFAGTVALIFQPAEENGGGGQVMVAEGVMDRFDIGRVYALHTLPGLPVGHFQTTPGPILAAVDDFRIDITGRGGHAAMPQESRDPIIAACALVQALQTIVSRNADPREDLVLSVTQVHAGSADNVIPATAVVRGTLRTFLPGMRAMARARMEAVILGTALAHGVEAGLTFIEGYPPTVNDPAETAFAAEVAAGIAPTNPEGMRDMGAEDFAFMLEARPGAYLYIGNGDTPGVHNPGFDFDDEAALYGASFFATLAERALPLG
ncbi:MAG: amidohydrolase [Rubellimicrobium sp.]|nr:amidohydrolase [Rubellimicrobium sp.]